MKNAVEIAGYHTGNTDFACFVIKLSIESEGFVYDKAVFIEEVTKWYKTKFNRSLTITEKPGKMVFKDTAIKEHFAVTFTNVTCVDSDVIKITKIY